MDIDEFGRDPQVLGTRRVFAGMEAAQRELLARLNVAPFDPRLRRWREKAFSLFQRAWAMGARKGMRLSEEDLAAVYVQCMVRVISQEKGVPLEAGPIPGDASIVQLVEEVAS
jgi:hypothetical protein